MKFEINDKVKLIAPVSYLKTSDNMPMLRPPDLVAIDEVGEILSIKSLQLHQLPLDQEVLTWAYYPKSLGKRPAQLT